MKNLEAKGWHKNFGKIKIKVTDRKEGNVCCCEVYTNKQFVEVVIKQSRSIEKKIAVCFTEMSY
jgi:hypothetical protein